MKGLTLFTALLLLIRASLPGQIPPKYLIDLKDTGTVSHILPRIPGIENMSVNADQIKSTSGIALDQFFYLENRKDYQRPRITSFDYTIIRNSKVVASGQSNSPLWNKTMFDSFKKIKKGDSLFVYNIKAFVRIEDSIIDLTKAPNIIFDTFKLTFATSMISPSEKEISLNKKLQKLPGFSKLSELYASDVAIDRSTYYYGFRHNKTNDQFQVRYQFLNEDRVEHDFTFIENRKGNLTKIYDNLSKKEYTIKKWENMIEKIR